MISDADIDRVLTAWLADGNERAPSADVAGAIREAAGVAQRRPIVGRLGWGAMPDARRWLVLAAALSLAAAIAVGVGSALVTRLTVTPTPRPLPTSAVPSPTSPATQAPVSAVDLRPIQIEDWPVTLSIPPGWTEVEADGCCDYRHFAGTTPEGHLSVGHESPFSTVVCSPECARLDIPPTIPYSADAQLDALKAAVAGVAGSAAWTPLPPGTLPQVTGGAQVETTTTDDAGREWRRVHIVGLNERNLVTVAWSQPAVSWDPSLLADILANVTLTPAPIYSDGDLTEWAASGDFAMPIPGLWFGEDQPTADDGKPLSGVYRTGEGRVLVSVGDTNGNLGWCDPTCRILTGQTSVAVLTQSVLVDAGASGLVETEVDSEAAVRAPTSSDPVAHTVVAMHDGRPVAIRINVGEWDVPPETIDDMIAGFRFVDPVAAPSGPTRETAGGRATIRLPKSWVQSDTDDAVFTRQNSRLTVRAGRPDGSILRCDVPAGPWDQCERVTVATLEDLAAAVMAAPIDDHGVGPPVSRRTDGTLDGEPSAVVRTQAYEYPAQSAQEVAYVVAMHEGRPYILRYWTSKNELPDLESVIAGFRFVDPGP